jgi:hypothetical protein
LPREDLIGQYSVDFGVWIKATVSEDDDAKVLVRCLADRRKNYATCTDASQNQSVDALCPEENLEIAS